MRIPILHVVQNKTYMTYSPAFPGVSVTGPDKDGNKDILIDAIKEYIEKHKIQHVKSYDCEMVSI